MTDVLKEYLVKLGFKIDNKQYNQFKGLLNQAGVDTQTFSLGTIMSMGAASLALASFVVSANAGIASYLGSLAKADMDTELFAKRMWVTAEQGKAIQESLKATGRSMEDVWFSPELREQFIELQKVAREVATPQDFKTGMKDIRDVQLEFMKLKVIMAYMSQHVGMYLTKYLAVPIANIKKAMVDFNAYLKTNMPNISSNIAKFLAVIVRVGETAVWVISSLAKMINSLPDGIKMAGAAALGLFAVFASGPAGMMLAGLSLIMLLLEDFYTYSQGGKSAFPEMWGWISGTFGEGTKFAEEFNTGVKALDDTLNDLYETLGQIYDAFNKEDVFGNLIKAFGSLFELGWSLNEAMGGILESMIGLSGVDLSNLGLGKASQDIFGATSDFLKSFTSGVEGVTDWIKGVSPVPQSSIGGSNSVSQTIQNTNNIYGSDAYAIGAQVDNNWKNLMMMRDFRGVFV